MFRKQCLDTQMSSNLFPTISLLPTYLQSRSEVSWLSRIEFPKKNGYLDNFCFSLIKIAQMTLVLFAWTAFGLPWLLPCRSLRTPCSRWNDDTYDTQDNIQRFGQACFNKCCEPLRLRQVLCLLDQWDELLKDFWPQRIQWQPCSSHRCLEFRS